MKKLNLFILCLCFPFLVAHAAVPSRIVYQGRLSKSGVGAAGRHTITVQFVDKDGTNLPYSQTVSYTHLDVYKRQVRAFARGRGSG